MSQKDLTQFFILSRGRTGSTLLHQLLDSHPNCICFEEIFADRELPPLPKDYPAEKSDRLIQDTNLREENPVNFLNGHIYTNYPSNILAAGFKLFYFHSNGGNSKLWEFLKESEHVRVIHLQRKNVLRMFTSMKIAAKTGLWWSLDGSRNLSERAITLDPSEFLEYASQVEREQKAAAEMFHRHPLFKIYYEEYENFLVDDEKIRALLDFLDLPFHTLHSEMEKQNPESLRDLVLNYDEMKEHFSQTSLHTFFDDMSPRLP